MAGKVLCRPHHLLPQGDLLVIKLLGGGSLLLVYPSLLGLRKTYPTKKIRLLCTKAVKPFAEILGVFDEIIILNDRSVWTLTCSVLAAFRKMLRSDTVLDLEIYSLGTTVLSALTTARNRIGFYQRSSFWRKNLHTHLIYFNQFSGIYLFYEKMAELLGATPLSFAESQKSFRSLELFRKQSPEDISRVAIGSTCSDMGKERLLTAEQWIHVFRQESFPELCQALFLGTAADRNFVQKLIDEVAPHFPQIQFQNLCGETSLKESIQRLSSCASFWGVDSSLLHFARLLGKKTLSFWGPTDPLTRLKDLDSIREKVFYKKIACSPCIHTTAVAPCFGNNVCIQGLFKELPGSKNFSPVHYAERS